MATTTERPKTPRPESKYSRCPECDAPLEATVSCYLSDVEVNEEGFIVSYRVAFQGICHESSSDPLFADGLNLDDPQEVRIYCSNDHQFDLEMITAAEADGK